MKTALEEALYHLELHVSSGFSALEFIETCKEVYLEKEKEQIIEAYSQGYGDGVQEPNPNDEYYNQTYNQNK